MKVTLRLIVLFLAAVSAVFATSVIKPGAREIVALGVFAREYRIDHRGELPTQSQLIQMMSPEGYERMKPQIVWLEPAVSFHGGRLMALGSYPILEDEKPEIGRYALFYSARGDADSIWIAEAELRQVLTAAGVEPPGGKLFVRPVSDWTNLPAFLRRMPAPERAEFIKTMKERYQIEISEDGRVADPAMARRLAEMSALMGATPAPAKPKAEGAARAPAPTSP